MQPVFLFIAHHVKRGVPATRSASRGKPSPFGEHKPGSPLIEQFHFVYRAEPAPVLARTR